MSFQTSKETTKGRWLRETPSERRSRKSTAPKETSGKSIRASQAAAASDQKMDVIEGEYSAFCYTIKERSVLNDQPKDIQLILRKNTQGEAILEFENKNGDIRFIKADLVTDVESDPEDPLRFSIKYRVFTCNISNMAVSASRISIPLKPNTEEG